ncbi:hypothetical protein ACFQ51_55765 [Streptomyces kaempferi]
MSEFFTRSSQNAATSLPMSSKTRPGAALRREIMRRFGASVESTIDP